VFFLGGVTKKTACVKKTSPFLVYNESPKGKMLGPGLPLFTPKIPMFGSFVGPYQFKLGSATAKALGYFLDVFLGGFQVHPRKR